MSWLFLTCGVLGLGVAGLWANARRAQTTADERDHYRLSIRFWSILAGMGLAVPLLMVAPLAGWGVFKTFAAQTAALLCLIPPSILIGAGAVNAISLGRTMRRRDLALAAGGQTQGVVVDRRRGMLSQDLMVVELEMEIPVEDAAGQMPYRPVDPHPVRKVRVEEICPADNWERLSPGTHVEVAYDPEAPQRFALLLFGPRQHDAPALPPAGASASPQLALEGPAERIGHE